MPEPAFKGTVLEGRERRYTVINEKDVKNYLDKRTQERLVKDLDFPLHEIHMGRVADGKNPYNSYIVINVDEPYVNEIIEVMKQNGHWEGKTEKFQIEEMDGCEFVRSIVIGKFMISFHQDFDGYPTGKIHVVYPDGSQTTKTHEEAQKLIDSGEWTILR